MKDAEGPNSEVLPTERATEVNQGDVIGMFEDDRMFGLPVSEMILSSTYYPNLKSFEPRANQVMAVAITRRVRDSENRDQRAAAKQLFLRIKEIMDERCPLPDLVEHIRTESRNRMGSVPEGLNMPGEDRLGAADTHMVINQVLAYAETNYVDYHEALMFRQLLPECLAVYFEPDETLPENALEIFSEDYLNGGVGVRVVWFAAMKLFAQLMKSGERERVKNLLAILQTSMPELSDKFEGPEAYLARIKVIEKVLESGQLTSLLQEIREALEV